MYAMTYVLATVLSAAIVFLPFAWRSVERFRLAAAMILFVAMDTVLLFLPLLVPAMALTGGSMNWSGKIFSTAFSVVVLLAMWRYGFTRDELGFRLPTWQSVLKAVPVVAAFMGLDYLIMGSPEEAASATIEQIAFQAAVPGISEELGYRGVLFALAACAWSSSIKVWNVPLSVGMVLVSVLFGIVHGIEVTPDLAVKLHYLYMIPPTLAALMFAWLRASSSSLLLPIVAHNLVNLAHYI